MASSCARSLRAWKSPWISTRSKLDSHSARNSSARYSRTCHGLSDFGAPGGASVSTFGVDTNAIPFGRRIERKWSSTAFGSCRCSMVWRKTTASHGSE